MYVVYSSDGFYVRKVHGLTKDIFNAHIFTTRASAYFRIQELLYYGIYGREWSIMPDPLQEFILVVSKG